MTEDSKILRDRGMTDTNRCPRCQGGGVRWYSSTATWRGGMGGCAMTTDVCDECWGSGRTDRIWANIRKLEQQARDRVVIDGLRWLGEKTGCRRSSRMRIHVRLLAEFCAKQSRKRKIPDGFDAFWWHHHWDALASILNKLAETPENPKTEPSAPSA